MQPEENGVRTWQWLVTVIVIVVLIALGYYMFKGDKAIAPSTTEETMDDSSLATSKESNRIVVTDQFPGNIVYISSVQLANPGFVVIHADKNGQPGDIIGYQYFDKGINPGKITLTKSTMEGSTYYAMLHLDNGDKKFDIAKDLPVKNSAGNIIMKVFRVTSTVAEVK